MYADVDIKKAINKGIVDGPRMFVSTRALDVTGAYPILGYSWEYFFFSSRRRHTRCSRDWSSDVCSSDLDLARQLFARDRVALVVPLFMEGAIAAVLVVGEKLSGEIFDSDEIKLLEMLAGE